MMQWIAGIMVLTASSVTWAETEQMCGMDHRTGGEQCIEVQAPEPYQELVNGDVVSGQDPQSALEQLRRLEQLKQEAKAKADAEASSDDEPSLWQ